MKRVIVALLLLAGVAIADRMPDPSLPERVGRADLVILAKVTKVEGKDGANVAVLEVKEKITGASGSKTVKLAYTPAGGRRGFPLTDLKVGDERLFLLTRQHGTDTYRLAFGWDVTDASFAGEARRLGKLLADPMKGLKSKDAAERALTAGLLVQRYRTRPLADAKTVKEVAIPAAESELILNALAEADWKVPEYTRFTPRSQFLNLGLTDKDGWKLNFATLEADAKKWLTANAGKYRIKKYTTGVTAEP